MTRRTPKPPPFETLEPFIQKAAAYCHVRLPYPKPLGIDDLFGEAGIVYCNVLDKWDPDRGSFFTLYHTALKRHLTSILHRAYKHKQLDVDVDKTIEDFEQGTHTDDALRVLVVTISRERSREAPRMNDRFLECLSRDAHLFVRTFLDPPRDFLDFCRDAYTYRAHASSSMRSRVFRWLGWKGEQRERVMNELREKVDLIA